MKIVIFTHLGYYHIIEVNNHSGDSGGINLHDNDFIVSAVEYKP